MADPAQVDLVFHALGDPRRRPILKMLSERPHPVKGLAGPLGITVTAVGQQLRLLEASGLVATEKVGRVRTARLDPAGLAVARRWIDDCRTVWERRLDRLADFLVAEEDGEESVRE